MENRSHARRRFLKVGVMSASATMLGIQARAAGPQQAHATGTEEVQVRYDELLPHEFRKRLEEQPIAYLPQVDHAARNETSLMMHFRPDSVDLTQLPAARDVWPQGVGGEDPRDATREHGIECLKTSVGLVRKLFTEAGLL